MARHPTRDRVDRVLDLDTTFLQLVGQFPYRVLTLGNGEPVAGDDDDLARIGEQGGDIFRRPGPHGFPFGARGACRTGGHRAEGAEEDVAERASHGITHQLGEQRARGAHERAGHDEREVAEHEPAGGHREAGERVEE